MFSSIFNLGKDLLSGVSMTRAAALDVGGFYKFQATDLAGQVIDFQKYNGCVAVIINVASK